MTADHSDLVADLRELDKTLAGRGFYIWSGTVMRAADTIEHLTRQLDEARGHALPHGWQIRPYGDVPAAWEIALYQDGTQWCRPDEVGIPFDGTPVLCRPPQQVTPTLDRDIAEALRGPLTELSDDQIARLDRALATALGDDQ